MEDRLRYEQEDEPDKECTFKPKINEVPNIVY